MNEKKEAVMLLRKIMGNILCDVYGCHDCKTMVGLRTTDECPAREFNDMTKDEKRRIMTDFAQRIRERMQNEHADMNITMDDLADIFAQEMLG